jgi:hypothetical protein
VGASELRRVPDITTQSWGKEAMHSRGYGVDGFKCFNSDQDQMRTDTLTISVAMEVLDHDFGDEGLTKPHLRNYIRLPLSW